MKTARAAAFSLISLTLLFTATGCATFWDLMQQLQSAPLSGFQTPTFTFKSVNVTNVSLAGLTLDTTWQLSNPNPVGLTLSTVEYALFIDDKQVLAGKPPQGFSLVAQGSTDVQFPASFKFADLVGVAQTFLSKDTAHWRAEGTLGVQTPIGELKLPMSRGGDFEVPKLPAVQLQDPKVTNLTLLGATIEFPVLVTNRNSYALPISNLSGTLSLAGQPIGTLSSGDLGALAGQGTKTLTVPLTLNFINAAGAAVSIASGGNAQVRFDAQLQSGGVTIPLQVDQLVKFVR
jgi:LEA14-like dessication related protein